MRRAVYSDTHEYAQQLASLLCNEGHRAYTARLFSQKYKAALVLVEGGKAERQGSTIVAKPSGRLTIWPNRMVRQGFVPIISPCFYCEGTHVKHMDGTYSCSVGRFVEFAKTFPSLRSAPLAPWSATRFARWARTSPAITHGSIHACAFILAVWSGEAKRWKGTLQFDVVRAFQSWDEPHRNAFRAWAKNPWWP